MRGCRTVLSTGHRLFIRNLSASAAPVNLDWHELFEKLFGKALPTRSSEKQLAGSAAFLVDIFKKAVHQKLARNKSLEQKLFIEELQLLDDVGLPKVFEHLIEELSVDHAVLLCTKLPASYLNEGINTLIRLLLERVLENNVDVADQDVLTDKLFELVKLSKGRNCSLSEETRERLLKWLSDSGDALKCNNNLQHLCQENIDLPQVKDGEETRDEHPVRLNSVRQSRILDTKSWIMQELPKASDKVEFIDITTKTRLLGAFYGLGKSAATRKGTDIYIQFEKLELKGMTEGDLKELVDSFTKGVTDVYPSSMDIRRGVEAFKRITQSLKLNTLASYNSLIGHCACHGEIDLAIDLIQTMKSGGLEPCAPSYEPLIKFFAKTLEVSKAAFLGLTS
ncbi:hypothetical protein L7F22_069420 [Adiantum nelumboides]|nr:hypothetical protein [Adiantum nelumboides]